MISGSKLHLYTHTIFVIYYDEIYINKLLNKFKVFYLLSDFNKK
jgi:hypothetical protein